MKTKVFPTVAAFMAARPVPWVWRNFKPQEIACKDGSIMVDSEAMNALQALRDVMGARLRLNSAYRSPAHNAKVGGAPRSYHMQAMAFDIRIDDHDPHALEHAARECGFRGIGRYHGPDHPTPFLHVDTGPERQWGEPWPYGEDEEHAAKDFAATLPPAPAQGVDGFAARLVKVAGNLKAKQRARA